MPLYPKPTCQFVEARLVHFPGEEFQANDGVDHDDEDDQERNVQQRNHRLDDGIQHDLQTWDSRHESQRTQDAERAQSLHIESLSHDAGESDGHEADHYDHEVQDVPHTPQVGSWMQHQSICYDLESTLDRENH